ncbi:hypothetical protein Tco_1555548, partial [Tanacetum coccineum]
SYEEKAFIQNGMTQSERLDFRPMTSIFESWNGEVLCKNVLLIDAGPSVEEHTILFKDAQDRPNVDEQTILIMEAQDHMKKRPLIKMAPLTSRFEAWNEEVLCKNMSLIDAGPSVEEQTILIMEAQDHMKKRRPSVEEQTILFKEAQDRIKKRPFIQNGITWWVNFFKDSSSASSSSSCYPNMESKSDKLQQVVISIKDEEEKTAVANPQSFMYFMVMFGMTIIFILPFEIDHENTRQEFLSKAHLGGFFMIMTIASASVAVLASLFLLFASFFLQRWMKNIHYTVLKTIGCFSAILAPFSLLVVLYLPHNLHWIVHHNNIMDVDILNGRMRSLLKTQVLPGPSTPSISSLGASSSLGPSKAALSLGNTKYSNCKLFTMKIKILEARLAMKRHLDDQACQSAAILHELLYEMENLHVE